MESCAWSHSSLSVSACPAVSRSVLPLPLDRANKGREEERKNWLIQPRVEEAMKEMLLLAFVRKKRTELRAYLRVRRRVSFAKVGTKSGKSLREVVRMETTKVF